MDTPWQNSWARAVDFWAQAWRSWILVDAVLTAWIWAIFLAVPALMPFILMQFQPINSRSVTRTYYRNLTQLEHQLPLLAGALVVFGAAGLIATARIFKRHPGFPHVTSSIISNALMAGFSLLGSALMRMPMGGKYLDPGSMVLRVLVILAIFVVVVPALFWVGPLRLAGPLRLGTLVARGRRDVVFLPWTWLVAVVVGELLSAAIAWTANVTQIGTLVLAFILVGAGLLHQSVAYFYVRSAVTNPPAKECSAPRLA